MKTEKLVVIAGRVSCPRHGNADVEGCFSCGWFQGLVQDRHPLIECGLPRLPGAREVPEAVPGLYLG